VTSPGFQRIALVIEPPVTRITLEHPPLNVIDIAMMEELTAALAQVEVDPAVSVIVLAGSEKAFSTGVDVAAHTPDNIQEMLSKFHAIFKALVSSHKVTMAAVRGSCLGGGAELAMVCDLVLTAETASWGFPEISLGCFPPVAATALAALIGQKRAAELILTGRTFDGLEAQKMGLANYATREAQLETKLGVILEHLAKLSPAALFVTKKAIYAWDSIHFDKGLARAEKVYLEELMQTEDAQEGVAAFLEKRVPKWRGK
jgi:cyclohexa-1,5-dienecarbonyl-CoA hydratase